jgi:hypothetical protein
MSVTFSRIKKFVVVVVVAREGLNDLDNGDRFLSELNGLFLSVWEGLKSNQKSWLLMAIVFFISVTSKFRQRTTGTAGLRYGSTCPLVYGM